MAEETNNKIISYNSYAASSMGYACVRCVLPISVPHVFICSRTCSGITFSGASSTFAYLSFVVLVFHYPKARDPNVIFRYTYGDTFRGGRGADRRNELPERQRFSRSRNVCVDSS